MWTVRLGRRQKGWLVPMLILGLVVGTMIPALAVAPAPGTTIQITTNPAAQRYPAIYGDRIVWQDDRNGSGNTDIYMYDLATGTESPICLGPSIQEYPDIYQNRIVWQDYRNGNYDIYMYDLASGTETQITSDPASQERPVIYGDRIIWQDNRNGNYDIYMYDLASGTETLITNAPSAQVYPAVCQNRVVWQDYRNGNYDIYMYDLVTGLESRITTDPAAQEMPSVYGDRIVWADGRNDTDPNLPNWDIYMYDLVSGLEKQISTDLNPQTEPEIWQDQIVWTQGLDYGWEIRIYDLTTGTENQIAADPNGSRGVPAIDQGKVVWEEWRTNASNQDIYLYTPAIIPKIIATDPDNGTANVPVNKIITVTFNENIQPGSNFSGITLKAGTAAQAYMATTSNNVLTIVPASGLDSNATYTVGIPAGAVQDAAGNILVAPYTFGFSTPDTIAPAVTGTDPANGTAGVPVDKVILITFSENVLPGGNYNGITLKTGGTAVAVRTSVIDNVLQIWPASSSLAYNTTYTVDIPADAIKDAAGNVLAGPCSFSFTTYNDVTPPTVTGSDPVNGASGVPIEQQIRVYVSENVKAGVNFSQITLQSNKGVAEISAGFSGNTLVIIPAIMLASNTTYTLTIPPGAVTDMAGNPLPEYNLSFTTVKK